MDLSVAKGSAANVSGAILSGATVSGAAPSRAGSWAGAVVHSDKLHALQALRAIAAIMVVLFHMQVYTIPAVVGHGDQISAVFGMGYAGVEIFFVLSGFIMVLVHRHQFGQPRHALPFIMRRIERIYPLLWVVLIALIGLRAVGGEGSPPLGEILRAFTLWPTAGAPVLEPTWSLTFEMLFYLIFATLLFDLRLGLVIAGLWFGACLVSALTGWQGWGAGLLMSAYNVLFLFGIVAALSFRRLTPGLAWAVIAIGVGLFAWVGMGKVYGMASLAKEWRTLGYGLGAMGIVAGLAALDAAGRIRTPRIMVLLGDASYAIYLLHVMAMTLVVRVAGRIVDLTALPVSVVAVGLLLGALVVGTLVHLVVERPILRWFRARRAG